MPEEKQIARFYTKFSFVVHEKYNVRFTVSLVKR